MANLLAGRLIESARLEAGPSGAELARRARTSRPTLAAYEHGVKSPTLETATRLLAAAGFRLDAVPVPSFEVVVDNRGRPFTLANVFAKEELVRLAQTQDDGFDLRVFADMIGTIARFTDDDLGLPRPAVDRLRHFFSVWRQEITGG
ncbi:helix-turn-helix transcriptional regulator [Parafrankia sp. FMc6]|uniref:helix-turn-helix domain-containing protein n=1 Tax=Parafrankia soli TaxID=2599596 RepID=UPI0034D5FC4A